MMSATIIAGTATLAALAIAGLTIALLSWRQARAAAARAAALADALAVALEGALSAEAQQAELRAVLGTLRSRLDRMILKQGRVEQPGEPPGYQAAIDLTRDGADDDVLMNTCGLTRGEARLIRNLYQSHAH